MKTVVILGAGCSYGLAKLPVDKDFLETIREEDAGFFLKKAYEKLYNSGSWASRDGTRLEVFWSEIDENYNSPKVVLSSQEIERIFEQLSKSVKPEDKEYLYYRTYAYDDSISRSPYEYLFMFAGWELRKLVASTYSKRGGEDTLDKYKKLLDKINSVSKGNNDKTPVFIDFNYDTLLEQSLEKYHYLGLHDNKIDNSKVNIIKPHGSVNWLHIVGESITAQKDAIPPEEVGYNRNDRKLYQHSIVGLVSNKIEFNAQKQESPEVASLYAGRILPLLKETIRDAEILIIIGYSFPRTDKHVWNAMRKAKPANLKKVIVVNKDESDAYEKRIEGELREVFPSEKGRDFLVECNLTGVEKWIEEP